MCPLPHFFFELIYFVGEMLSLLPSNQILPRLEPIVAPQLQMLGTLGTSANKQDQQVRYS